MQSSYDDRGRSRVFSREQLVQGDPGTRLQDGLPVLVAHARRVLDVEFALLALTLAVPALVDQLYDRPRVLRALLTQHHAQHRARHKVGGLVDAIEKVGVVLRVVAHQIRLRACRLARQPVPHANADDRIAQLGRCDVPQPPLEVVDHPHGRALAADTLRQVDQLLPQLPLHVEDGGRPAKRLRDLLLALVVIVFDEGWPL